MARRKNPEGETPEQAILRRKKEKIGAVATRNDRINWTRKFLSMKALIKTLAPHQKEILKLMRKKKIIQDEIDRARKDLIGECVHPLETIVEDQLPNVFICKFCDRKFKVLP